MRWQPHFFLVKTHFPRQRLSARGFFVSEARFKFRWLCLHVMQYLNICHAFLASPLLLSGAFALAKSGGGGDATRGFLSISSVGKQFSAALRASVQVASGRQPVYTLRESHVQ